MKLSLIVIIANEGYADEIMDEIRHEGVKGGTIINGNSSVSSKAEKLYGVSIHKEKDCLLVIVDNKIKNKILKCVHTMNETRKMGAIAFTMPISDASSNLVKQYNKSEE